MEDYYARDLTAYYGSLQMGLHHNYYFGRNDPDLSPWLSYFTGAIRQSAGEVRRESLCWSRPGPPQVPLPPTNRRQRNLLVRCLNRALTAPEQWPTFTPGNIVDWFGITDRTAHEWLDDWRTGGLVEPVSGEARIRRWALGTALQLILEDALRAEIAEPPTSK